MQRAMTMILVAAMGLPVTAVAATYSCENRWVMPEFPGSNHAGYLGVGLKDVSDDRVAALKLKDARGVEVIALDHDGPAAKVGIREHDVILDMNGQEVASEEQLRRMLRETPAGRKADLTLSRDGQEVKVEVVLGDRTQTAHVMPDMENLNVQLEGLNNIVPANGVIELDGIDVGSGPIVFGSGGSGASVETLGAQLAQYFGSKDGKGVLVKEVRNDSAAAKAGLRAGDVIVKAGGQMVANRMDWERVTRDNRGKAVSIEILREKRMQKLSITPPAKAQGALAPTSFVIEDDGVDAGPEMMAALQQEQDPQAQKELQDEMEKMRAEMAASSAEVSKAMAEVKTQMQSPEFKKEMEDAQRQAEEAVAEWKSQMPGLKKQLAEAQAEADRAAAQWSAESPAMQAQIAQAKAEAEKAASEWKAQQPEIDKQLREAQEQMKKAAEEMRQQLTPMD